MPPAVRRAGPDDVPAVAPLFDAYRVFYGRPSDPAAAAAFLRERLTRGQSVVLLAHDDGVAVGFVQLYPSFSSVSLREIWILNDLYVAEAARRSGAGRALMLAAEAFARESGALRLELTTAKDNHAAKSLYRAVSYEIDEVFERLSRTVG